MLNSHLVEVSMQWLIKVFLQILMHREEKYKPKHTACALFGFWIQTKIKRKGNYWVKYLEIYWGLFPYLTPLSLRLFGDEKYVLKERFKISLPVRRRCVSQEIENLQKLFDENESVNIL